ncbi:MAG TPA: PAS domain-containing protein, partial [Pyrinomonadaceae bacterium]
MSKTDLVKAIEMSPVEPVESGSDGVAAHDGDGDRGFVERRKAAGEQRLAAEANALTRLHEASTRLWQIRDLKEGLAEIISATIDILEADMGNIQLLEGGILRIAAHRGFDQEFLGFFHEISAEDDSACGRAMRKRERVIIEDVEIDDLYAPYRDIARNAGYRGVQTSPLICREGKILGMVSTHFREPHRPSEQDLRRLDLYLRQAADFIERCRSEERHRQILSLMHAAVYSCDTSGRITYFNDQAVKLWGREPKIGDTDERFCGSEQMILPDGTPLAHEDCPMAVALREGESFRDKEVNIRRPDGSVVTVLVNVDPTRNERGEITGAINTFHDVSTIKEAEEALIESESTRRFAMQAAGAGSWTWDAATNAVSWSSETYELFGIDPKAKLVYESWRNSLHPDDRQRTEAAVLHAMEVGSDL